MFKTFPRLSGWLLVALLLAAVVWLLAPQQLSVTVYKLSLVAAAAVAGYWLDRSLFPYARPDRYLEGTVAEFSLIFASAMLRRAVIVAAAMLAVGLGA